jgi:hypothetical protein
LLGGQSQAQGEGESNPPDQESEPVVIDLSNKSLQREMVYSSVQSQGQTQTTVANDGSKQTDNAANSTESKNGESQEGSGEPAKEDEGPPPSPPAMPNLSALNGSFFTQGSRRSRAGGAEFGLSSYPTGGNRFASAGTAYYGGGSKTNAALPGGSVLAGSALPVPQIGVFSDGAPGQVAGFQVFGGDFEAIVPAGSGSEAAGVFNPQAAGRSPALDAVNMLSAFAEGELGRMNELAASLTRGFEPFAFSGQQGNSLGQMLDTFA